MEELGTIKLRRCHNCKENTIQAVTEVRWFSPKGGSSVKVWYCSLCKSYWQSQVIEGDISVSPNPEAVREFYPTQFLEVI